MDSNAEFIFELRQIEESAHPIAAALQDGKPTAYARRVALLAKMLHARREGDLMMVRVEQQRRHRRIEIRPCRH